MKRMIVLLMSLAVMTALLLCACQPQAGDAQPGSDTAVAETETVETEASETEEVLETEVIEAGPQVGGTLVYSVGGQPDTLDAAKTNLSLTDSIVSDMSISLVSKNVEGEYIPYGAESWESSEDGLTWTFYLRDDIKFHNGDPVTANDWVYTFERILSPEIVSPAAAGNLEPVASFEATDEYTLVITLKAPYYPFLDALSSAGYLGVISQRAVDELGEQYGNPDGGIIGAGPYMFSEWVQDEKLVLTRNPDFTWGPEYFEGANPGPYYIENLEYRIVADYVTTLAALSAGDLNYAGFQSQDLATIEEIGLYDIISSQAKGVNYLEFNLSKPPFDNILIRQAFNYAVDRQQLIDVALNGLGTPVQSILTSAMAGYWPGVEEIGYQYDVERAKELLTEAGYTYNADGMAEKDGQPFEITLYSFPDDGTTKIAQLLVAQLAQIGVTVTIQTIDVNVLIEQMVAGDFEIATMGIGAHEADILNIAYKSTQAMLNHINDPEMDALLDLTRTETDPEARQQAVNNALTYIVEHAYCVPMYTTMSYIAIDSDIDGYVFSPVIGVVMSDAYFADLP